MKQKDDDSALQDGKAHEIERKYVMVSTLVKTSLDTGPTPAFALLVHKGIIRGVLSNPLVDHGAAEIPIPGVASSILMEVVSYMNHHKGVEPPIIEKPLRSKVVSISSILFVLLFSEQPRVRSVYQVMKDVCKDPFDAEFIDRIGEVFNCCSP
jgi:hypothetical protein